MIGAPITRSAAVVGLMATALTLLGMGLGRRVSFFGAGGLKFSAGSF